MFGGLLSIGEDASFADEQGTLVHDVIRGVTKGTSNHVGGREQREKERGRHSKPKSSE